MNGPGGARLARSDALPAAGWGRGRKDILWLLLSSNSLSKGCGTSWVKSLSIRKVILKLELGINMPEVRKYLALAQQQMLQDKRYSSLQIYYDVDPL